jgi:hypothetical protein
MKRPFIPFHIPVSISITDYTTGTLPKSSVICLNVPKRSPLSLSCFEQLVHDAMPHINWSKSKIAYPFPVLPDGPIEVYEMMSLCIQPKVLGGGLRFRNGMDPARFFLKGNVTNSILMFLLLSMYMSILFVYIPVITQHLSLLTPYSNAILPILILCSFIYPFVFYNRWIPMFVNNAVAEDTKVFQNTFVTKEPIPESNWKHVLGTGTPLLYLIFLPFVLFLAIKLFQTVLPIRFQDRFPTILQYVIWAIILISLGTLFASLRNSMKHTTYLPQQQSCTNRYVLLISILTFMYTVRSLTLPVELQWKSVLYHLLKHIGIGAFIMILFILVIALVLMDCYYPFALNPKIFKPYQKTKDDTIIT